VTPVTPDVVVFGQLARDLVLVVDEMPAAGGSAAVRERREMLGGKGANQAVALSQLGMRPALVAVAGDDDIGTELIEQANKDGIDTSAVARRPGAATALMVDIVDGSGRWRYLEQVPGGVRLNESDVERAATLLTTAEWASVQLQQPPGAAVAAARAARRAGCSVVLDGAPAGERDELLGHADVVRADAREAELLSGVPVDTEASAKCAAAEILGHGPGLVALAVGEEGNFFAWRGGCVMLPLTDTEVADTTGAGDALVAALIAGLASGYAPERAARLAVEAAGVTVGHPGGRPDLTGGALARQIHTREHQERNPS
jgi:ribokinase